MTARRIVPAIVLALALVMALAPPTWAVQPDEVMGDPALEARARTISRDLRCLVCQNQSIDDSDAELARDLRVLVRHRLAAGDSDAQVVDYVVSRYGDFVLLKPPFKPATYALWLGPAAMLGLALLAVVFFFRRRRAADEEPPPLDDDERRRLAELLRNDR
jgi:cytochrome c-type biogenesis protein CcmH